MNSVIVDTSVVLKFYLEEPGSENALHLLDGNWSLHAPEYLQIESNNVLLKRTRRNDISKSLAKQIHEAINNLPIIWHPNNLLMEPAFLIAIKMGCSFYDALFLALSIALNSPMITDDLKLIHVFQNTPFAKKIKRLADFV